MNDRNADQEQQAIDRLRMMLGLPPEGVGQQQAGISADQNGVRTVRGSGNRVTAGTDALPSFLQEFEAEAASRKREFEELSQLGYEYNGMPRRRQ